MNLYERNSINLRPLRPYQQTAIEKIKQAIREGHKRIMLQAPTGAGKTLLSAHLIAGAIGKGKRPIFTCPAITLVEQTLKSFESEGIYDIGIIQAQHERTNRECQVQIASVQTLIRREHPDVDFLIIDEAHEVFKGLNERLSTTWQDKLAIGLSATPWTKGLGLHWTKLIVVATIQELIDQGYLCPFTVFVPEKDFDRSQLRVQNGEFTESSSSQAMTDKDIIGNVVEEWREKSPREKTFMYCVNRAHAQAQMNVFTDFGIPFGYIDANTPMEMRTRIFEQMRYGEIAGISSVGCLIRGVDEDVRAIIDCQPRKSESSHVQKWGRGLRTAQGKDQLIGMDHAGNFLALGDILDIQHEHLDMRKPGEKGKEENDPPPPKPLKCPKCRALLPYGSKICRHCGMALQPPKNQIEHKSGKLVEFSSKGKPKKDEKQEFYSQALGLALERGYSDGWSAHLYRSRYQVWPRGLERIPKMPSKEIRDFDYQRRREYRNQQGH